MIIIHAMDGQQEGHVTHSLASDLLRLCAIVSWTGGRRGSMRREERGEGDCDLGEGGGGEGGGAVEAVMDVVPLPC